MLIWLKKARNTYPFANDKAQRFPLTFEYLKFFH